MANVLFRVLWGISQKCIVKLRFIDSLLVVNFEQKVVVNVRPNDGRRPCHNPVLAIGLIFALFVEYFAPFHIEESNVPRLKPKLPFLIFNSGPKSSKFSDYIIYLKNKLNVKVVIFKIVFGNPLRFRHLFFEVELFENLDKPVPIGEHKLLIFFIGQFFLFLFLCE